MIVRAAFYIDQKLAVLEHYPLQRMIKSVVFTHNEDDIEFKRFAFYHNLSASKVTVDESVTDYDTVHAAEITFMKCEYMLCAINLF